jgi:hypothetical protein
MVVGLLASLFMIISTFLTLARSDNRRLKPRSTPTKPRKPQDGRAGYPVRHPPGLG